MNDYIGTMIIWFGSCTIGQIAAAIGIVAAMVVLSAISEAIEERRHPSPYHTIHLAANASHMRSKSNVA
jgi:hypothetical protein